VVVARLLHLLHLLASCARYQRGSTGFGVKPRVKLEGTGGTGARYPVMSRNMVSIELGRS
jgi:hypothetical protein